MCKHTVYTQYTACTHLKATSTFVEPDMITFKKKNTDNLQHSLKINYSIQNMPFQGYLWKL